MNNEATELEFLRYFFDNVDLGPAQDDIIDMLKEDFKETTGKELPEGY